MKYLNKIKQFEMIEDVKAASPDDLIKSHLRLVSSIAIKLRGYSHPNLDDYIQEGNIALIKCAHAFDPSVGVKFATYCMTQIQKAIINHDIDLKTPVRILTTHALRKAFFNLKKYQTEDKIDVDRMSAELNISVSDIQELLTRISCSFKSIQIMHEEDNSFDVPDASDSPDQFLERLQYQDFIETDIKESLSILNDRERFIIENRYFSDAPMIFADIAPIFGVSIERIRQIEAIALKKMKKVLTPAYEACKIETA